MKRMNQIVRLVTALAGRNVVTAGGVHRRADRSHDNTLLASTLSQPRWRSA